MFQIFLYFRNITVNFPYALVSVGLTEGLLTLNLVDEITGTKVKEIENIAQGGANILNGFFHWWSVQ
jgi:SulP family sulfate permease